MERKQTMSSIAEPHTLLTGVVFGESPRWHDGRVRDGDLLMTDGPFAESKEHVGGFLIIKAQDLDAALEWAGKATRAVTLPIEVRPFQGEPED
jgi:hypothetical protein